MPLFSMGNWGDNGREITEEFSSKRKYECGAMGDNPFVESNSKRPCIQPHFMSPHNAGNCNEITMATDDEPMNCQPDIPMNQSFEQQQYMATNQNLTQQMAPVNHHLSQQMTAVNHNHVVQSNTHDQNTLPEQMISNTMFTPQVPVKHSQRIMNLCGETYSAYQPYHDLASPKVCAPTIRSYCKPLTDRAFCMRSYFSDYY